MAEIFGNRRNRLTKKDLHASTVKANQSLREKNKRLKNHIKTLEADIGELELSAKDIKNEIKALKKERTVAKRGAKSAAKELSRKKDALSAVEKATADLNKDGKKIQVEIGHSKKEADSLKDGLKKMHDEMAVSSSIKAELKLLKVDKHEAETVLSNIKDDISKAQNDLDKAISYRDKRKVAFKGQLAKLEKKIKEKSKVYSEIEGDCTIKVAEQNSKITILTDTVKELQGEEKVLKSVISKREQDFIDIESKVAQATHTLEYTVELTNKEIEREKEEKEKLKKEIESMRQRLLEEVARLKMKKKIELIDKAGLKDIISG
jgi:chromosome segregation ATPase